MRPQFLQSVCSTREPLPLSVLCLSAREDVVPSTSGSALFAYSSVLCEVMIKLIGTLVYRLGWDNVLKWILCFLLTRLAAEVPALQRQAQLGCGCGTASFVTVAHAVFVSYSQLLASEIPTNCLRRVCKYISAVPRTVVGFILIFSGLKGKECLFVLYPSPVRDFTF